MEIGKAIYSQANQEQGSQQTQEGEQPKQEGEQPKQ
jgi:hypothetical protein